MARRKMRWIDAAFVMAMLAMNVLVFQVPAHGFSISDLFSSTKETDFPTKPELKLAFYLLDAMGKRTSTILPINEIKIEFSEMPNIGLNRDDKIVESFPGNILVRYPTKSVLDLVSNLKVKITRIPSSKAGGPSVCWTNNLVVVLPKCSDTPVGCKLELDVPREFGMPAAPPMPPPTGPTKPLTPTVPIVGPTPVK